MPVAVPWHELLVGAGVAQLILVVTSLAIPRLLNWKGDLAKVRPLTRQVFWTYAAYIWVTNLRFADLDGVTASLTGPFRPGGIGVLLHHGLLDSESRDSVRIP